ncbi:hypothetical protein BC835DRAFT_1095640 [Cytidiella melzeri]|nr:hypothetical protein BC835DRAFT_1095640 [Cytidiella melzeri]
MKLLKILVRDGTLFFVAMTIINVFYVLEITLPYLQDLPPAVAMIQRSVSQPQTSSPRILRLDKKTSSFPIIRLDKKPLTFFFFSFFFLLLS